MRTERKGRIMSIETRDRKLELLPPELQREVVDFVEVIERFVGEMESEI